MVSGVPLNEFGRNLRAAWIVLDFALPLSLIVLLVLFLLYLFFFTSFVTPNRVPRYFSELNALKPNTSERIFNIEIVLDGDGQPTLSGEFLTHQQIHDFCLNANPPNDLKFRRSRSELRHLAEGSQVECTVDDRNLQNPFDRYHFVAIVE
ncbi:hypothetical protein M3Y96_00306800 [Aphelenchoides besseyi]|nr:hypothetical protein M3Y96_00306800 [Aphelenchoides besseyi]